MLPVSGDGIGLVNRGVALWRQKLSLPDIRPMQKPSGMQTVESAHLLQADDVGIELLHRVAQVVNLQPTRRP